MVASLYPDMPHLDCHSIIWSAKVTYNRSVGTFHEYTTTSVNMDIHGGGGTHNLHISIIMYNLTPWLAAAYEPGYSPVGSVDEHVHIEEFSLSHLHDTELRE